jgi:hypothetical protein
MMTLDKVVHFVEKTSTCLRHLLLIYTPMKHVVNYSPTIIIHIPINIHTFSHYFLVILSSLACLFPVPAPVLIPAPALLVFVLNPCQTVIVPSLMLLYGGLKLSRDLWSNHKDQSTTSWTPPRVQEPTSSHLGYRLLTVGYQNKGNHLSYSTKTQFAWERSGAALS